MRGSGDYHWKHLLYFLTKKWFPTSYLAQARMFQQKNNQKVVCNMYNWAPILVSNFSFLLLPTGSPLMKSWQFWLFQSPPNHTNCYLTAKSSPWLPNLQFTCLGKLIKMIFFRESQKYEMRGGSFYAPPTSYKVKGSLPYSSTYHPLLSHMIRNNIILKRYISVCVDNRVIHVEQNIPKHFFKYSNLHVISMSIANMDIYKTCSHNPGLEKLTQNEF